METIKFCLVRWSNSKDGNDLVTIIERKYVTDDEMVTNPKKEGMVIFGDSLSKPPFKTFLGRVIATSDSKVGIRKKEDAYLKRSEVALTPKGRAERAKKKFGSDDEDNIPTIKEIQASSKSLKRDAEKKKKIGQQKKGLQLLEKINLKGQGNSSQTSEKLTKRKLDAGSERVKESRGDKKYKRRRSTPKYAPLSESDHDESDEERLSCLSSGDLIEKVMSLRRQKTSLLNKVEELKKKNLFLQEGLPALIETKFVETSRRAVTVPCLQSRPLPLATPRRCTLQSSQKPRPLQPCQPCIVNDAVGIEELSGVNRDESQPLDSDKLSNANGPPALEDGTQTLEVRNSDLEVGEPDNEEVGEPDNDEVGEPDNEQSPPSEKVNPDPVILEPGHLVEGEQLSNLHRPTLENNPGLDTLEDALSILNDASRVGVEKAKKFGVACGLLMRALFADHEFTPTTIPSTMDQKRINLIERHILKYFKEAKPNQIREKIRHAVKYRRCQLFPPKDTEEVSRQ